MKILGCFFLSQNVSIAIVSKDMEFTIYDDDDVAPFLEGLEERPQRKVPERLQTHRTANRSSVDLLCVSSAKVAQPADEPAAAPAAAPAPDEPMEH